MKNLPRFLVCASVVFLTLGFDAKSQICHDLDTLVLKPDTSFAVNFSRTFNVTKQQRLVVVYTFYGKNDYYFAIAGKEYMGNLQFKLIETTNGKLLFDSSLEQYCTRKIITFDNTMNLSVEVMAPYWSFKNGGECIRLLIGSRYSIVNNFNFSEEPPQ